MVEKDSGRGFGQGNGVKGIIGPFFLKGKIWEDSQSMLHHKFLCKNIFGMHCIFFEDSKRKNVRLSDSRVRGEKNYSQVF